MDVPAKVAKQWLSAPPIEPRFHNAIANFSNSLHLPAPPPIPEAKNVNELSQATLTLHSGLWRGAASFSSEQDADVDDFVHWGVVHFTYGPIRVASGITETTLDTFIDGQRYFIRAAICPWSGDALES